MGTFTSTIRFHLILWSFLTLLGCRIYYQLLQDRPTDMTSYPMYNNACLSMTSQATPDPFITYSRGKFYLLFTGNDRIPMWEASNLLDFYHEGDFKKGAVW